MTKKDWQLLSTALVGIVWIVAAYASGKVGSPQDTPTQVPLVKSDFASTATSTSLYPVVHVVDGDTIDVMKDGVKVRVRLIGVNAPESVDPRRPVQCFGKEASAEMKRLLEGQPVSLEADPSQDLHDKYGRLLAYAYLSDGSDVGLHMISAGFAYEYTYNLPYAHQTAYKAAQRDAEAHSRGLWAKGACED